jgi:hypothetical protein
MLKIKRLHVLCFALACSAAVPPFAAQDAQQPTESKTKSPQGTVIGSVYCADTNQPARIAQVTLISASEQSSGHLQAAVTDLEGHFAIRHVPDGKYYVAATFPGYLNLAANFSEAGLASMTPDERKFFDMHVPTVLVSPRQAAEVSLRLERAAEIDGTVQYDDGSPAISLHVDLKTVHRHETDPTETPTLASSVTYLSYADTYQRSADDHGRFRILGVLPGEYRVSVTVPAAIADTNGHPVVQMFQASSLGAFTVYAGSSLRASKAKIIKIGPGDSAKDADIIIPLSTLHSIRGSVVLKSTGQPPLQRTCNSSTRIRRKLRELRWLRMANSKSHMFPRTASFFGLLPRLILCQSSVKIRATQ